jgi:hypothetical protein
MDRFHSVLSSTVASLRLFLLEAGSVIEAPASPVAGIFFGLAGLPVGVGTFGALDLRSRAGEASAAASCSRSGLEAVAAVSPRPTPPVIIAGSITEPFLFVIFAGLGGGRTRSAMG